MLTPTQQRYATIELECMAIQWVIKKYEYYLRGLPTFDVLTDHRPSMLENNRLMCMREKIIEFTSEVSWGEGKTHYIAEALPLSLIHI